MVFKPSLTEQETIGDGHHPDFSNDLCVPLFRFQSGHDQQGQQEVKSFQVTQNVCFYPSDKERMKDEFLR